MRSRGYSLIEFVMVLIIIGIMVAFIAPALSGAINSYDTTSRNIQLLTKMRYAMDRMAREIRSMRRDPVNTANYDIVAGSMTGTKLEFCRADGTRVTIDNTTLASEVKLGYTAGFASTCTASAATTQTLTDGIPAAGFSFTYLTIAGAGGAGSNTVAFIDISMTLTAAGANSYTSTMRIDMRNP